MSERTELSSIMELKARVDVLPVRRGAVQRISTIRRFIQIANGAVVQRTRAREGVDCTVRTFPGADLSDSVAALTSGARATADLLKRLSGADSLDSDGIDTAFQVLESTASRALKSVEREWDLQISRIVGRYQPIVNVAERASLPGSETLKRTLEQIASRRKPQCSKAPTVESMLVEIGAAVRAVRLDGAGGTFLATVLEGGAHASDLLDTEISLFLTENNLWPHLTVRFS